MQKIRAAIVGYGNTETYVLEALVSAPEFEIAGIVETAAFVHSNIYAGQPEQQKYLLADSLTKLDNVKAAILAPPFQLFNY